jgi:hypothetical protein
VAPEDGVSAAAVAVRTLRVASNYIQHRKDREAPPKVDEEKLPRRNGSTSFADESFKPMEAEQGGTYVLRNIVPAS